MRTRLPYLRLNQHWKKHQNIYNRIIRIVLGTFLALLICRISVDSVEAYFYDLRFRLRPPQKTSGNIELVMIDLKTTDNLKTPPKAEAYFLAIEKIIAGNPKSLVLVFDVTQIEGSDLEKKNLARILKDPRISQISPDTNPNGKEAIQANPPFDGLRILPGSLTRDRSLGAKDGVSRRIILQYLNQWQMHSIIARDFNPAAMDLSQVRGAFELAGAFQANIDFQRKDSFPITKLEDLLKSDFGGERFREKLVLFGEDLHEDVERYRPTPYDRSAIAMSATELHANMIDTLIRNSAPVKVPSWLDLCLTILISILTVHVVLTVKPLRGILTLLSTAAVFTFLCYFAFWPFGYWIEVTHPLLSIFLCYYFFIPYRLIVENRRSWEYYHKHKLLTEVETLKTNFIGMMSHDLKTPLARIQGMTEIIANDSTQLSSPQREALDTVKQSAEDLTRFISAILNYAKIESQGVQLHLQSRDINELIKEVIKKSEFLAKRKHVQVVTEFEPLFAMSVDPDLIKQVLSNLIENAIKYSPENSKVLVTTDEIEGKIVVQVADQGIGIPADELSNIFTKFFRSKNAKSSPIKGSGLGLYLAKYFVELHQGTISCESSPGQGSTFTVELPLLN